MRHGVDTRRSVDGAGTVSQRQVDNGDIGNMDAFHGGLAIVSGSVTSARMPTCCPFQPSSALAPAPHGGPATCWTSDAAQRLRRNRQEQRPALQDPWRCRHGEPDDQLRIGGIGGRKHLVQVLAVSGSGVTSAGTVISPFRPSVSTRGSGRRK